MSFSRVIELASGHVEARIVQTAVELCLFEALEKAPSSAAQVAQTLALDGRGTELLLNALAALSLLQKNGNDFLLSDAARLYLLRDSPQYLGGMIHFEFSLWRCWESLPDAVRSGRPVRPPNMYQDDTAETKTFIHAMDSLVKARGDAENLVEALDWDGVVELLDVGSGPGTYPISLCRRFPRLRARVFDLPATLKITEGFVREANMADRIELSAGDYRFDSIPGSYDVIFLSNIVHGESFETNSALIKKLARHLNPAGRIVIKDHVLDENRATPPAGALFSLLMLLTTEAGRCYSFQEIAAWMTEAGLSSVQRIDLPSPLTSSLIIGAVTGAPAPGKSLV